MNPADKGHLRVVVHELGHALVGRSLGWAVRTVVTVPGAHTSGWCEHFPKTGLSPLEEAADRVTTLLAGEAAALMVPMSGYLEDVDGCAERAEKLARAALDRLPAEDGSFVYSIQADTKLTPTDREKAERDAQEAAGEEHDLFLAFCAARARRLVAANVRLFSALVPVALANPILTGDDVEQAIAVAQSGQKEG